LWNPNAVQLQLKDNTWLKGAGAETFLQLDNAAGKAEVVILLPQPTTVAGHGEMATFILTTEDIVLLQDVSTGFTIDHLKLVDERMVSYPVGGSSTTVTLLANGGLALVADSDVNQPEAAVNQRPQALQETASPMPLFAPLSNPVAPNLSLYPNPASDWLAIELGAGDQELRSVNIYQVSGQLRLHQEMTATQQCRLDVSSLEKGNYLVQITTDVGTVVRQINK
jgi:hypothetical protein